MAHVHEKIDFTADVFIVCRGKVLLRMHDKYHMWASVGGHIDLDEDPNQAAVRECKEEVGLDVVLWDGMKKRTDEREGFKELIPPVFLNRHITSGTHEHIGLVYFAVSENDDVVPGHDGDRSDEWKWCAYEDLETMDLHPDIRAYARAALDALARA